MADPATLADLIGRLEKAEAVEPERLNAVLTVLACDIHAALVAKIPKGYVRGASSGRHLMAYGSGGRIWSNPVPTYLTSLDDAVSLCRRAIPKVEISLEIRKSGSADVVLWDGEDTVWAVAEANFPALAMCLATLRALASSPPVQEPQG